MKPGRLIWFKEGLQKELAELVVLEQPDDGKWQPPVKASWEENVKFPMGSLTVSRDGKLIAAVGATYAIDRISILPVYRVLLVDAETSRVVRKLECDSLAMNKLVFSPDGKRLAAVPD